MYHFLQALPSLASELPVSQEIPSLTSIYQTHNFHFWQAWQLPTGTGWWVATHSIGTSFNLLVIPYCVCLALQTSDCLTCTSVRSGANIKHPMNNNPGSLRLLQNHTGTYTGISSSWCKKKELLRASRQDSAECHRTAHKGNMLKPC